MNTVAHKLIMRSHQTGRDFATIDETAMSELLSGGYAVMTRKTPIMRLTEKGKRYAEREIAWAMNEAP